MPVSSFPPPKDIFDDDDDGWQDMPIVREDKSLSGLDEEDQKKYHYQTAAKATSATNATGNLIDVDDWGNEWRSKLDQNESEYTRLRGVEEEDADEVHLRTRYLFDEDKAMTPLSQMQQTKNLLTEAQRIAYVGLCALISREMVQSLKLVGRKELKPAITNMELWALKIMGRLYYHMELETQEQKMIESLAEHGVLAEDLVPALMATHTVANPEYDPEEARRKQEYEASHPHDDSDDESISDQTLVNETRHVDTDADADADTDADTDTGGKTPTQGQSPTPAPHKDLPEKELSSPTQTISMPHVPSHSHSAADGLISPSFSGDSLTQQPVTTKVFQDTATAAMPGVTTTLSSTDEKITLDIRWTILCDLFLLLIADSVYDARSRVLLEQVAVRLGLGWLDVVKFESRITQALEIQEDVETLDQEGVVEGARKAGNKRRYMMLGLATLGGGLVIGLSAGLLAPVIGLGLAGALSTVGMTGATAFLGGTAGAAVITTGGVLTGSSIAVRGMINRTQQVRTFVILPLHNNKRVNCILTVPGFMNGINDDVRLPFSVLDPVVGDVYSVLWEPEMIRETGSALKILTGEVLSQIGMTVLQATVMTGLMSALQWPIILTKLGYLIDNPWSNALDRAKAAGRVLADVLINRHLGVRPITLIGFSLGARVIFYALVELAKQKAFGVVQDVFLLGATLTVSQKTWCETRSVVSGRYVNAFARNDWVLNYLFRASSGAVGTVAGLRPIENVPGLENVDVTDKIAGHMSYRTFMPLILDQLGFPVSSDFFDEPVEPDFTEDRVVVTEEDEYSKGGWFGRKKPNTGRKTHVVRPPSTSTFANNRPMGKAAIAPTVQEDDEDLPPREGSSTEKNGNASTSSTEPASPSSAPQDDPLAALPKHAGFDLSAMKHVIEEVEQDPHKYQAQVPAPKSVLDRFGTPPLASPSARSHSTPPVHAAEPDSYPRSSSVDNFDYEGKPAASTSSYHASPADTPSFARSASDSHTNNNSSYYTSAAYSSQQKTPLSQTSFGFGSDNGSGASSSSSSYLPRPSVSASPVHNLGLPDEAAPSWGARSTAFGLRASPPMVTNPFAASSNNNPFASAAALSFGSQDGSIAGPSGGKGDAWSIPPLGRTKKNPSTIEGFNANPWS